LSKVSLELQQIGNEAVARADWMPGAVRCASASDCCWRCSVDHRPGVANLQCRRMWRAFGFRSGVEAAINDIVFFGIAIFFLVTLEARIKRSRAQGNPMNLRALAHIIDMHQLTKDPSRAQVDRPQVVAQER